MADTYRDYLIAIATQRDPPTTINKVIIDPVSYVLTLIHELTYLPITRLGLDQMADVLFGDPRFASLLTPQGRTYIQGRVVTEVLPLSPPAFRPFWDHVLQPAWDQHAELALVKARTASS